MSAAEVDLHDARLTAREAALWGGAAALVLAVHVGGGLWALQRPADVAADDLAPAAVMIDLAPEPVAPPAEEEQITPDLADAEETPEPTEAPPPEPDLTPPPLPEPLPQELTPPEVLPEPELAPPPLPEPLPEELTPPEVLPEPEPELPPPPLPEPLPEELTAPGTPPSEVAVTRPVARPADLPKVAPEEIERPPAPERAAQKPQSAAAKKAEVQAPPAEKVAAPQTAQGGVGSVSPKSWQSKLMTHLERRKRYPPAAKGRGEEGVVYVRFTIDDDGRVLSSGVARSSGHPDLDKAVLDLVRRASPVPAPPPGVARAIIVPVRFNIR